MTGGERHCTPFLIVIASAAWQSLTLVPLPSLQSLSRRTRREKIVILATDTPSRVYYTRNSELRGFSSCRVPLSLRAQRGNPLPYLSSHALSHCHCERSVAIPYNSSYRSRHSLFMPLTSWSFLCLEPSLSCFSLKMAFPMSSNSS